MTELKIAATSVVKIDKNIPMPPAGNRGYQKYPWDKMEVGDSFLLQTKFPSETCRVASARRSPKKFTYRKTPEGFRAWRIA